MKMLAHPSQILIIYETRVNKSPFLPFSKHTKRRPNLSEKVLGRVFWSKNKLYLCVARVSNLD